MLRSATPLSIVMIGQKGLPARSGGIERHVGLLASGLAQLGHTITVYARAWYTSGTSLEPRIHQVFTSGIRTKHLDAITHGFTALMHARTVHPDVIHLHGSGIALLTPFARLLHPRARIFVTLHCVDSVLTKWGTIARLAFQFGERFACWFAHEVITVSQVLASYYAETYGRQTSFITHPFSSVMPTYSPDPVLAAGFQPGSYLLMVARLIPDKQAHVLVDAYAEACVRLPQAFSSMPLVIIGDTSWTDDYARMLRAKVRNTKHVYLLGERVGDEVRAFQAHAFAHVFPSGSEGMPFSLLEAGASGQICIATNLPQHAEALGTGFLPVESGSVESLTRALCIAVSMSKEDRAQLTQAARTRIEQQFAPEDRIYDVDALYQSSVTAHVRMAYSASARLS